MKTSRLRQDARSSLIRELILRSNRRGSSRTRELMLISNGKKSSSTRELTLRSNGKGLSSTLQLVLSSKQEKRIVNSRVDAQIKRKKIVINPKTDFVFNSKFDAQIKMKMSSVIRSLMPRSNMNRFLSTKCQCLDQQMNKWIIIIPKINAQIKVRQITANPRGRCLDRMEKRSSSTRKSMLRSNLSSNQRSMLRSKMGDRCQPEDQLLDHI